MTNKILRSAVIALAAISQLIFMGDIGFAEDGNKLTLKVLCDDKAISDDYLTEHGLSIYVHLPNGHS